jgi:hypothetical protein
MQHKPKYELNSNISLRKHGGSLCDLEGQDFLSITHKALVFEGEKNQ